MDRLTGNGSMTHWLTLVGITLQTSQLPLRPSGSRTQYFVRPALASLCPPSAPKKSSHQWLNDRTIALVDAKRTAGGHPLRRKRRLHAVQVSQQPITTTPPVLRRKCVVSSLRDDSSTGPDLLPARILKRCAEQLGKPLQSLLQRMLETQSWPESWREHWVVPIYKKKAVFAASNYRGIHLTAQLSKVAERLLLPLIQSHISRLVAFGPNQFAYTICRGARDALAYLTMSWLLALNRRKKVAVYCSDVSEAFDRVLAERLLEKLRCKGVHPTMVALTESWLQQRTAHVVDEGQFSDKMVLKNMVFQSTVLGPSLWNLFYEDARRAIHETGFEEIVYADDLNGFKEFEHNASIVSVLADAKKCQTELHKWSRANQVSFDLGKESAHIVSHAQPHGDPFKLLGICFDCKLQMDRTRRGQ